MTVYLVIFLPKTPYIHRIYIWLWPTLVIEQGSAKTRTRSDEYGNGGEISNTVAGYTAYFGIFVRFGQTLSMTGPVCSTHPCHAHCGLHTGLATCVCLHIVCDRMHEHLCDRMHEHLCDRMHERLCDRMQAHLCDRMQAHLCDRMHEHCPATC